MTGQGLVALALLVASPALAEPSESSEKVGEGASEVMPLAGTSSGAALYGDAEIAQGANPYDDPTLAWRADSRSSAPPPQAEPRPEEKSEAPGEFEQSPKETVEGAGHVVPTTGFLEKPGQSAPPFSVGGVTAKLGKDTWFKFYGFVQTRYVSGQHHSPTEGRVAGGGFSLARTRLFMYGRLTDWLRILIRLGATADGTARFEQAFADFRFKAWTVRVGQFYLPAFQEQALSPVSLQALDFSAVGSVFDGGQTQGARVSWDLDRTRLHLFVTDGFRTGFSEAGDPRVADLAISTRTETALAGDYSQFDTGSAFRGEPTAVLLGAGLHYQSGGELADDAAEMGSANVDVTFESHGVSLHCSAAILNTETAGGTTVVNGGIVVQGGAFVLPWTELYGRYEAMVTTASPTLPQSVFRGMAVGLNQYVWPERGIRLTADYTHYFDPTIGSAITPNPNSGLFESAGPQWSARMQFNVLF